MTNLSPLVTLVKPSSAFTFTASETNSRNGFIREVCLCNHVARSFVVSERCTEMAVAVLFLDTRFWLKGQNLRFHDFFCIARLVSKHRYVMHFGKTGKSGPLMQFHNWSIYLPLCTVDHFYASRRLYIRTTNGHIYHGPNYNTKCFLIGCARQKITSRNYETAKRRIDITTLNNYGIVSSSVLISFGDQQKH